jgi:hypothetical protein
MQNEIARNEIARNGEAQMVEPRTALIPFSEVKEMSQVVVKSGLFGVKTPEQALALMMLAQAEGLHPMVAARDYHIIDGKPSLKADTKLGRFVRDGGNVEWIDYSEKVVSGKFTHPKTGAITVTWTIEQAQRAGLISKDNWRKYPRAMLRARVIGEGVTTMAPWVAAGIVTKEEADDFDVLPQLTPPIADVPLADVTKSEPIAPSTTEAKPRTRRTKAQIEAAANPVDPVATEAASGEDIHGDTPPPPMVAPTGDDVNLFGDD